jgi:cysteinylglycine-S-conjugate dipeptidase
MSELTKALDYLETHKEAFLDRLGELVKIQGVSAWPEKAEELKRSAEAVRQELENAGLTHTEILTIDNAPPYAYGEWLGAPGKPTLLLYAHHDVQPPGEEARWKTAPFEPTKKEGPGGLRLYGRGSADDKAGAMCHVAAIESWLKTSGALPCNIKVIIEGEEEIGSLNLSRCLQRYKEKLMADVLVLTDTSNYDTGVPSLTYSLRGLVGLDVELRTVDHAIHSGMWGGPCIDPLTALCKLLGTLHNDDGSIAVKGFYQDIRQAEDWERTRIAELGYCEEQFRKESGLLPDSRLTGEADKGILERLWLRPTITVIGLDACSIDKAANKILPSAKARLSCRIVANQEPGVLLERLKSHLQEHVPFGAEMTFSEGEGVPGWVCVPKGPAFDAAERALEAGFSHKTAFIGSGGTIPFVGPFAEAFGGAPALLLGLEDPYTNAHGENESLHIEDFYKLMNSTVRLLEELSKLDC